ARRRATRVVRRRLAPDRRDARAGGRRLARDPHRRRPRLPGARRARGVLSRHRGVRRLRRAGVRVGRSGGRGPVADRRPRAWHPDPLRPRSHESTPRRAAPPTRRRGRRRLNAPPPANPKVVIIVGPVASMTSYYWSDANAAAAEALKYTNNVVKIYTPHATWARVKTALQGASVVINMGHGNGWPSPYAPYQPYTKDGLGLNPKDTSSENTTTQYWGEYYLARDIRLAP